LPYDRIAEIGLYAWPSRPAHLYTCDNGRPPFRRHVCPVYISCDYLPVTRTAIHQRNNTIRCKGRELRYAPWTSRPADLKPFYCCVTFHAIDDTLAVIVYSYSVYSRVHNLQNSLIEVSISILCLAVESRLRHDRYVHRR